MCELKKGGQGFFKKKKTNFTLQKIIYFGCWRDMFYFEAICSLFVVYIWSLNPTKLPNIKDFYREANVQISNKCYTFPYWPSNKQEGNKQDFNINPSMKQFLF